MKIFIIGAAGSIGSELCRQLSKKYQIIAVDQDETGIFNLNEVIPEIANIRDKERLDEIFKKYEPEIVYHAAAYKHLSKYEKEHLSEVIKTNIIGTLNIIELCQKYKSKLIFISTDKAVNPTSLMGTTKLLGEIMVKRSGGVVVRFGNVIESRGSVIPIWRKQIAEGKPITITNPNMKRYFITAQEACKLVIKASEISKNGEVIILDMGEPKYIIDIAKELFGDYKFKIIGEKEGEKMEEELMTELEKKKVIKKDKFFIIR